MNRNLIFAALAVTSVAGFAASAQAQVKVRSLEEAVESTTAIVSLPESVPSSLGIKPCAKCTYLTLSVDDTTRFFIGRDQVGLADLRRYANRGLLDLDVFYDAKSKTATRLILRTELDAADAAAKTTRPAG